jgi:hypothetical protein
MIGQPLQIAPCHRDDVIGTAISRAFRAIE